MPSRLFACTPSRLASYVDCPRRYRMTYVDRPAPGKGPPWAHNTVGAAVHLVLKRWWDLPAAQRTVVAGLRLLEAAWSDDGFRDPGQSWRYRQQVRTWLSAYVARLDPGREPAGVERTVSAATDRLVVSGRVDRLDRRGAELVVVDYKTGRAVPDEAAARDSQPLALYVLGTRRVFRAACRRVELHHPPTGTTAAYEHSEESLQAHVGRAEDTAAAILGSSAAAAEGATDDEAYPPRPGPGCGWCDVRRHCPEGRRAASPRESWEGLRS